MGRTEIDLMTAGIYLIALLLLVMTGLLAISIRKMSAGTEKKEERRKNNAVSVQDLSIQEDSAEQDTDYGQE